MREGVEVPSSPTTNAGISSSVDPCSTDKIPHGVLEPMPVKLPDSVTLFNDVPQPLHVPWISTLPVMLTSPPKMLLPTTANCAPAGDELATDRVEVAFSV